MYLECILELHISQTFLQQFLLVRLMDNIRREFEKWGGIIFSSPGQSPGRAIVLPPALALALAAALALAKC